jgi:hypothetical protein
MKKKKKRFDWAVTRDAVTVATPELETMGTINMENNKVTGANVIKLFYRSNLPLFQCKTGVLCYKACKFL